MSVKRLAEIPGFNIDRVAAATGDDPNILRLENLDTDIPPPPEAVEATRAAVGTDEANSWLPFTGRNDLKLAVARQIVRRGGPEYDGPRDVVITSGEGDAMLDALFCLTDPGDEVILTDPTYAGIINRVRIVGAASLDLRMIAWCIGWVVCPNPDLVNDVSRVHIYNGLTPSGFAQFGVRAALDLGDEHIHEANREYQLRRDETLRQLDGLPTVAPHGAWSLLLDVAALGLDPGEVSRRLLEHKVAATSMVGWGGDVAARHIRFVFSNEPVERLRLLGERVRAALA